jgi:uncharacterized protein (DUF433 family)
MGTSHERRGSPILPMGNMRTNLREPLLGSISHALFKSSRGERHVFMFDKKCMVMQELLKRIVIDPQVMAGKPVIRGTRITVDLVLELLAAGMSPEEISQDYRISIEDIRAVLLYAARVIGREEVLVVERS